MAVFKVFESEVIGDGSCALLTADSTTLNSCMVERSESLRVNLSL